MTASVPDVLGWRPAELAVRADEWTTQMDTIRQVSDVGYRAVDESHDHWHGAAAETMRARFDATHATTKNLLTALEVGSQAARTGAADLEAARVALSDAVRTAELKGYTIGDDGTAAITTATHQTLLSQLPDTTSYNVAAGALQYDADAQTTAIKQALEHARTTDQNVRKAISDAFSNLVQATENQAISYGLPNNPGGYGSYSEKFFFRAPGYTPGLLMEEIANNFDSYFPFTGCGPTIESGKECSLDSVAGPQPVRIEYVGPDGIVIKSLPGHVEGADRTITFKALPTTGDLWELQVDAWGPVGGVSTVPGGAQLSSGIWDEFADNLSERLPAPKAGPTA